MSTCDTVTCNLCSRVAKATIIVLHSLVNINIEYLQIDEMKECAVQPGINKQTYMLVLNRSCRGAELEKNKKSYDK